MTLGEVKTAVDAGKTVHWSNSRYTVIKDSIPQYLIACDHGHMNANYVGLGPDYFKSGAAEDKFFIGG